MLDMIGKVQAPEALDEIARQAWAGLASGQMTEEAAHAVAHAVEARRQAIRARFAAKPPSGLPRATRKHPRSPDREASIRRRRTLAASGLIPAAIAARFTTGEAAALAVVAVEVMRRGRCALALDHIAALAGISRTTAQTAFRIAARLGIISVTERRQPGWRSLPNIIRIADKGWAGWIAYRGRVQKAPHHVEQMKNQKDVNNSPPSLMRREFPVCSWHAGAIDNRKPATWTPPSSSASIRPPKGSPSAAARSQG